MRLQSVFKEEKREDASVKIKSEKEITPPIFDLVEHEDFYLLAVDLPSLPDELQIVAARSNSFDLPASNVLFRCRALGDEVQAIYYEGQLWLLLPKHGRLPHMRPLHELSTQV